MNEILHAIPDGDAWRLRLDVVHAEPPEFDGDVAAAASLGRQAIEQLYRSLGQAAGVWQLEFPKAMYGSGEMAVGLSRLLVDRCRAEPDVAHAVTGPVGAFSMSAARQAFREAGFRISGARADGVRARLRFWTAVLLAMPAWAWTALRHGQRFPQGLGAAPLLFALHGESSTRTRHLLRLLGKGCNPAAILVLGRPVRTLDQVRQQWRQELGAEPPPLVRPFDWLSAVRALPECTRLLREGARLAPSLPWLPSVRLLVAQVYRCLLGAASARWWRPGRRGDTLVVYGHTGLADTTPLEVAQQQAGASTVHAVHGVSAGVNFIGRSSVAIWRCGHDARWHDALGGYGRNLAVTSPLPPARGAGRGLLLVSNLAHPMNPRYQRYGLRDEEDLLREAARLASTTAEARPVRWCPHPETRRLPEAEWRRLVDLVSTLDIAIVDGAWIAAADTAPRWVLCTPSTMAIDLMSLGMLPLLVPGRTAIGAEAVGRLPRLATLADVPQATIDEAVRAQVWTDIGPAQPLDCQTLADLMA